VPTRLAQQFLKATTGTQTGPLSTVAFCSLRHLGMQCAGLSGPRSESLDLFLAPESTQSSLIISELMINPTVGRVTALRFTLNNCVVTMLPLGPICTSVVRASPHSFSFGALLARCQQASWWPFSLSLKVSVLLCLGELALLSYTSQCDNPPTRCLPLSSRCLPYC
jgi:hypothetical protein